MRAGWRPTSADGLVRGGTRQRPGRTGGAYRGVLAAAAALLVLVAAGCGDEDDPDQSTGSPTPAASTPRLTPTVDPEREEVLAAYERYLEVANTAANRGEADFPELDEVAMGLALAETRNTIRFEADNGRVYAGTLVIASAEVTKLDVDAPQGEPQAVIDACIDITNYVLTHVDSGEPVDVDRGLEMFMVTVNLFLVEDRWIVAAIESHRDTPCQ
jgi:hypothetical protein